MTILPFRLASVAMTDGEVELERRRRGYWLRLAREQTRLNQEEVARRLGMSERSGGTISLWEAGRRDPSATRLSQLARLYGVPVSWFMEPRPTDVELMEEAKALAVAAIEAEQEDWAAMSEEERARAAEDASGGSPRRRSA